MIVELVENNILTAVLFGILVIICWISVRNRRPHGVPPGPTPLPIIGNALDLKGDIRHVFQKLRKEYGDVFSIYMGDKLTVVFNGYESMKEAFVKNGDVLSDRPEIINYLPQYLRKSKGIVRANGETWQKNRRFALTTLRDFGMGKNMLQIKIQEEVTVLIEAIEDQNGEPFDIYDLIQNAVSNIICSIVFGKRSDYDDKGFQHYLAAISKYLSGTGARSAIKRLSILRFLPGDLIGEKQVDQNAIQILDFIKDIIAEQLESYDKNNIRSLIDAYIKQEKLTTRTLSSDDIHGLDLPKMVCDLFIAGTETSATALLWSLLYFLKYPDVQEKANAQVSSAAGTGRLPGVEDRLKMPYLEATIMEVLRHANIAPLTVPHTAKEDMKFREFFIPKGTIALINIDSVMTDDGLWAKPNEFNPNRFLEGQSLKKYDYFIPFGIGKRTCLGESLARMELTIFLGALTRHFKFLPPKGEGPPSMEGKVGSTFAPNRYLIRAIKRS